MRTRKSSRTVSALSVSLSAVIFGVNLYVCKNLFGLEFSSRMESIESSYLAISRWAMANWGDLSWYPLWFNGMPYHQVYQPGLHLSVAALATALSWTAPHAYHFVTAFMYSGGAVALFWLCQAASRNTAHAFTSALLYSLLSPSCFLVPLIRADSGGWLSPRRYQILIHYGEGPHTTAVAMIPIVIAILHGAVVRGNRVCLVLAPIAVAAVVLTNWPGTIGLALAIAAYILSRIETMRLSHWLAMLAIAASAYLMASPWIPPSLLSLVLRNAQQSDGTSLGSKLGPPLMLAGALAGLAFIFARFRINHWMRFFIFFTLTTGAVSMGREWFDWRILPQPNRFQVEFEMAFCATLAYALVYLFRLMPPRIRTGVILALVVAAVAQARNYGDIAHQQTQPIDITTTIEYRMAKWFESNLKGESVFPPGNVSLWLNTFTDVPQIMGCCDQGIPNNEYRIATYTIYSGQNAGTEDAAISLLWMKAYGAGAVGVTGPNSTESFKPFTNWRKFEGVVPELWRDGDNAIFRVPRKSPDPVRVIPKSAIMTSPPENGLDVSSLRTFVAALEDPLMPTAAFRWVNRHEAIVNASVEPGQVLFLQVSHDAGWHAFQGNVELPIYPDPLGMMYVDPAIGAMPLRFVYRGGPSTGSWTQWLFAGMGLLGAGLLTGQGKSLRQRMLPSSV